MRKLRRLTGKKKEQYNNSQKVTAMEHKDVLDHKEILEHQKLIQEQIEAERPSFYNEGYITTAPEWEKPLLEKIIAPIVEKPIGERPLVKVVPNKKPIEERLSDREDFSTLFHGPYVVEKKSVSGLMSKWDKLLLVKHRKSDMCLTGMNFHEKLQYLMLLDLISDCKKNKLIDEKASIILLPIDHLNHRRPDCLITDIKENKSLTIQLKTRDISKYGNLTIGHLINYLREYANTDLIFIYLDKRFMLEQLKFLDNWNACDFLDKIVFMTFDEKSAINNYQELNFFITSEINRLNLDKNQTKNIMDSKFITDEIQNDTDKVNFNKDDYFSKNKSQDDMSDNILGKMIADNSKSSTKTYDMSDLDRAKMNLAREIKEKYGFSKLKTQDTHFGVDLFTSKRQVDLLKANGFEPTTANFLMAHATGFFTDK